MSYKEKLEILNKEIKDIKRQKERAENEFFKAAAEQIRDDFPFNSSHRNFLDDRGFFFSTNGKFKCSKTITYDTLFLGDMAFRFYHEKRQAEKVEKAKQIIEKLYEGEGDEKN